MEFTLNPLVITTFTMVLLPWFSGLVFKYTSNPGYLRLAGAVMAFVAEAVNYGLNDHGALLITNEWLEWVFMSFIALVGAQTKYLSIDVPMKLTSRPDGVLPTTAGVQLGVRKPSEYPPGQLAILQEKAA